MSIVKTLRKITFPLIIANLVAGGILSFAFAKLEKAYLYGETLFRHTIESAGLKS